MATRNDLRGGVLRVSAGVQDEYVRGLLMLIRRMADDVKRQMRILFESTPIANTAMDDNIASQARINLNALLQKWEPAFVRWGLKGTRRMIDRTLRHSQATLGLSLKEISGDLKLDTGVLTDRLKEIVIASTNEAVSLIRLIPTKYLGDVQGQVMRSITSGQGLKDLVPYLNKKYSQNIRHARNVAMDQTRKAYTGITAGRMAAIGVQEYEWVHTGGSREPRPDHVAMSGNTYRLDDPPVIDQRTGERGIPGQAPFCRCAMRPIVRFTAEGSDATDRPLRINALKDRMPAGEAR